MAPLTRSRSDDDGIPPVFAADYYAQRAVAGLIISEATNISRQAIGYALTPGIWSDEQVAAWRPIVQAVHDRGGTFFLQLWHTGPHLASRSAGRRAAGRAVGDQADRAGVHQGRHEGSRHPSRAGDRRDPADRRGLPPCRRQRQGRRLRRRRGPLRQQLSPRTVRARQHEQADRPLWRLDQEPPALSAGGGRRGGRRLGRGAGRHPPVAGDDDAGRDAARQHGRWRRSGRMWMRCPRGSCCTSTTSRV